MISARCVGIDGEHILTFVFRPGNRTGKGRIGESGAVFQNADQLCRLPRLPLKRDMMLPDAQRGEKRPVRQSIRQHGQGFQSRSRPVFLLRDFSRSRRKGIDSAPERFGLPAPVGQGADRMIQSEEMHLLHHERNNRRNHRQNGQSTQNRMMLLLRHMKRNHPRLARRPVHAESRRRDSLALHQLKRGPEQKARRDMQPENRHGVPAGFGFPADGPDSLIRLKRRQPVETVANGLHGVSCRRRRQRHIAGENAARRQNQRNIRRAPPERTIPAHAATIRRKKCLATEMKILRVDRAVGMEHHPKILPVLPSERAGKQFRHAIEPPAPEGVKPAACGCLFICHRTVSRTSRFSEYTCREIVSGPPGLPARTR